MFGSIEGNADRLLALLVLCVLLTVIWRDARAIRSDYAKSNRTPEQMKPLWGKFRRAGFTEDALYVAMMIGFVFVFFYSIKFATERLRQGEFAEFLTDVAIVGMVFTLVSAFFICGYYTVRRVIEKYDLEGRVTWTPPRVTVFFSAVFAPFGFVAGLREVLHETPDAIQLIHHWISYFLNSAAQAGSLN
jgi:hypothetical protein